MNLPERIKMIRKTEGLTQSTFAEKLSVTRDIISNFESGRVAPKPIFLNYLCEVFNINKDWLFDDLGDMYNTMTPDEEFAYLMGGLSASDNPKLKNIIKLLCQIEDESDLDLIMAMAEKLAKQQE